MESSFFPFLYAVEGKSGNLSGMFVSIIMIHGNAFIGEAFFRHMGEVLTLSTMKTGFFLFTKRNSNFSLTTIALYWKYVVEY